MTTHKIKKSIIMKNLTLFLAIASLKAILLMGCVTVSQRVELLSGTNIFTELETSQIAMVYANTVNGRITITGNDVSEAIVEMIILGTKSPGRNRNWTDEKIKEELARTYDIDIQIIDENLRVVARPKPHIRDPKLDVSFKITVPKQVSSSSNTVNGRIEISNLHGSHALQTVNGALRADSITGRISSSVVNGRTTITNSRGNISGSSVNGRIALENLDGDITMSTVNGRITAKNTEGQVRLSAVNGRIVRE